MLISCSICFLHTPFHFYPTSTALFRSPDSFSFSPLDPLPLVGHLLSKALYAYSCSLGTRLVMLFFPFLPATLCAPVDGILFPLFPTSSCRVLSPFDYDVLIAYSPEQIPATTVFVSNLHSSATVSFATSTVPHFCCFPSLRKDCLSTFPAVFLKLAMAVQTYTPHELLRLKKAPVGEGLYGQLQAKLRQDQDLGKILSCRYSDTFANRLESF